MKRVVEGKTYDTDTAKVVAKDTYEGDDAEVVEWLYVTTGGAFFVLEEKSYLADHQDSMGQWLDSKGRVPQTKHRIMPLDADDAREWLNNAIQAEVLDQTVFVVPDEATAEDQEGRTVTFTLRIPEQMRDKLQKSAKAKGVSMNAYLLQCAESCLKAA